MAHRRRLAPAHFALALLACAAAASAATRPLPQSRPSRYSPPLRTVDLSSDSESLDPFELWDDYESIETTTARPRLATKKTKTKVILKTKIPSSNMTKKGAQSKEVDKKVYKTTHINIQSHTNFIVTKKPLVYSNAVTRPSRPVVNIGGEYVYLESANVEQAARPPAPARPLATTRRPPSTTKRRPYTRRTTVRPVRKATGTTKAPFKKKTTKRPPKKGGWLPSFFQQTKIKKKEIKKPANTGWFSGFFSRVYGIYNWISRSNWLSGGGWFDDPQPKQTTTTTTEPTTTTTSSWFQNLLDSEDNDGAYMTDVPTRRSSKKSLKKNYKGYQLLRTYPDVQWKVKELLDLQEEALGSGLMWWSAPSLNGSSDLLVPPDLLVDVKDHLKSTNIDFDVVIWDLQKAISYENPRLSKKQRIELEHIRGHPLTWRRYHRYADILRYLEYLQHSYSDIVELVPLGRSSEGLPLVAVKISLPTNDSETNDESTKAHKKWKLRSRMKPAVWVDGGAHAREWIAPAVASWMLHSLVEGEKGLGGEYELLKQADFYIMPVLNPDGYEHSHTHDRLWSKTRSRLPDHADDYYVGWFPWNWGRTECVGVDVDRNWDYRWSEKDSSRDPCADNYAGPHPFSEPETRAVSEFVAEHKDQIKVFITLHAYSQAWIVPSSYGHVTFTDDGVPMEMGKLATAALADLYGTKFQVGTASEIRQPATGMSHDWANARAGIKFSYHVDLRDSYGPYGFLLPGAQIIPTGRETWQAVKAIVDNLSPTN